MKARIPGGPTHSFFDASRWAALLIVVVIAAQALVTCTDGGHGDSAMAKNVYIELVDWHIVGLWVINCPCCWIRVVNYNNVPVKNVHIRYKTFGYSGELLSQGTYTIDGTVPAGGTKNFIEQYVGNVDLESDMLTVELESVERAD